MARPRIGLVLGSGAAHGWAHIGVIEALQKAQVRPDIVCGCSIGALVGAAYVTGRMQELTDFVHGLNWRRIVSLLDVALTSGGLINGEAIVGLLKELGITGNIESLRLPYAAIATDLEKGREVWLREGPIEEAVRASISLPGIFSPCRRDDSWLVDGALVNPVPVSACRALGADAVIAVMVHAEALAHTGNNPFSSLTRGLADSSQEFLSRIVGQIPAAIREQASSIAPKLLGLGTVNASADEASEATRTPPDYFYVLTNSINIMQEQIARARLAGEPPHVMLVPELSSIGLMEFNRGEEAIAAGHAAVQKAMPFLGKYADAQK